MQKISTKICQKKKKKQKENMKKIGTRNERKIKLNFVEYKNELSLAERNLLIFWRRL